ncbi:hypothetical protein F5876DRAFT_69057 [Lentinula aff. lateritia]|uniref:Uncharacterized protein n=1 Tax=Lentinula aff. lateritia TaxID=2804960 RepID=A0ACC1TPL8_9AGAR|nr:hypothetical protein F5876DRAFT_69057 [Lentinula aff. lateritia]
MLFHSALQTLGIVAGVFFVASFVASVSARPYTTTAHLVFRKTGPSQDCRATILASKKRILDKVAAQEYADECVKVGFNIPQALCAVDLTNLSGILWLEHRIVKFVNISEGHESAACEKYSLLDFGEQVITGFTTLDKEKLMVPLYATPIGGGISAKIKSSMLSIQPGKRLKKPSSIFCMKESLFILTSVPTEFSLTTIREWILLVMSIQGSPGIWPIKVLPTKDQFDQWFDRRWDFLWGDVYREVDKMPEHQSGLEQNRARLN